MLGIRIIITTVQMNRQDEEISYATNKKNIKKTKIVFVGDQYVGKTSIINRFIRNTFDNSHNPTVGIDFVSKNIVMGNKMMRLQLWDTAGQERFRSLIPSYLRDSEAAFIIYDLTNEETFNGLSKWIDFIKENRGDDVLIFIVGNKLDLQGNRSVDYDAANQKFKELGIKYWEVSAKTGDNIEKIFQEVCAELLSLSPETTLTPLEINESKSITTNTDIPNQRQREKKRPQQRKQGKKLNSVIEDGRRIRQKGCC